MDKLVRIEAMVTQYDERNGIATVQDVGSGRCYELHAIAFIGGPLRLPVMGDRVRLSVVDGRASAARIVS